MTFTTTHFSDYAVGYNEVSFADVSSTDWYYDAVSFIAARGITQGVNDTNYAPNETLTRGQFIVMLMRAYGIEPDSALTDNFADAGDTYYTPYLVVAKQMGIATGVGDNRFNPDEAISRQDMVTLLYRALNLLSALPEASVSATVSDFGDSAQIADYAQTAIETFVAADIIHGDNGQLTPTVTSTRAQMAQIFKNLLG